MQATASKVSSPQHAITDLYNEQNNTFLVQFSPIFIVVMALAGVASFAITGFLGYAAANDKGYHTFGDWLFQKPWLLFLWFCAVMITVLWAIFRDPSLRRQRIQVLIVTALAIALVILAFYFRDVFQSLLNAIRDFLAQLLHIHIDQALLFAIINYGILAVFWGDSINRWVRRARGLPIAPEVDIGLPNARPLFQLQPPTLPELISGSFIAGAVLSVALWGIFNPVTMGAIANATNHAIGTQCATNCSAVDFNQMLFYFFIGLLVLALTALVNGLSALGGVNRSQEIPAPDTSVDETGTQKGARGVIQTLLQSLLGPFARRKGTGSITTALAALALALRTVLWPALILAAVTGLALMAQYIQIYTHGISCVHGGSPSACDVLVNRLDTLQTATDIGVIVAAGIVAILGTAFAPALVVFRLRVAENTLRFMSLTGTIILLTFWIFSLALSGFNVVVSPTLAGATTRWPFAQPGALTVISFLALIAYALRLAFVQSRKKPKQTGATT
jgi:hypothetical protein